MPVPRPEGKQTYITRVIRTEEENFAKTIDGGMKIFSDLLKEHKAKGETVFSGSDAFKLYDTYGFPIDLTIEMVEEEGMTVDEESFKALMEEQRVRARKAREALGDLAWAGIELGLDNTPTQFVGYTENECEAKILAIVTDGELSGEIRSGNEGIIVLDKTPFYAEMGGQTADHGSISCGDFEFRVNNVVKDKGGKFLHYGVVLGGEAAVDDTVRASICTVRRKAIMRAHSATHLLQKALQTVLGDHVHQAGSLVEPDRLRFDFTHFSAITPEELSRIENMVNEAILDGHPVTIRELCGGTHLDNTAKAGSFKIVSESSIASGVRRIEAITGKAVVEAIDEKTAVIADTAKNLKTNVNEVVQRAEQVMNELRDESKTIEKLNARLANMQLSTLLEGAKQVGAVRVAAVKLEDMGMDALRAMGDGVKDRAPDMVAVLASTAGEKVNILCVCGADAVKAGAHAGKIVKEIAAMCGGGGGGRPDSATAGGKDPSKLETALQAAAGVVEKLL